jgi:hypothetical protein
MLLASCAASQSTVPPSGAAVSVQVDDVERARAEGADRARLEVKRVGSSCEDITTLVQAGEHAETQPERDVYAAAASRRRYERTRDIEGAVAKVVKDARAVTHAAEDMEPGAPPVREEEVDDLHVRLRDALDLAATLTCYDAESARVAQRTVETSTSALDQAVACRASPLCQGQRLVAPICQAIAARDRATADDLKKEYERLMRKSFDANLCPKPEKDSDATAHIAAAAVAARR